MSNSLRDLQLCQLQALKDIANVCERYGIRYYLSSGTLLGAVRHKGFIPWDDDIDIEMPYKDYLRFLEYAPKSMGERYFLQNSSSDPYFFFAFTRIRVNNTTMMRDYEKDIPSHHGVWIDIFPLIHIGGSFDFRVKRIILRVCAFLRMDDKLFYSNKKYLVRDLRTSVGYMMASAARILPRRARWNMRDHLLNLLFRSENKPYISCVWTTLSCMYPSSVYADPPARLLFEDAVFSAPRDYDLYLQITYGNFMVFPPVDQRKGHGNLMIDLEHEWNPIQQEK